MTVGGTTAITVQTVDRYGNPVDSRNTAETVRFMVGAPAGFVVDGPCMDEVSVPVDAEGNAVVTLRVDTAAGENLVWIQPPAPVKSKCISITGVADGVPFSIVQVVNPASGSVRANGEEKVSFTYTLYDEYKNPAAGQPLRVDALVKRGDRPAEQQTALLYSNPLGQVMITYGPEDSVGTATITATADANTSVSVSQEVEFTSTDPVNMVLSASPQSMPSRDVKSDAVSELRAKVMDVRGNPVPDQTVEFEIISSDAASYIQTAEPALEETSATTDDNGYAIVGFYPGAFTTNRNTAGWDATATGTATVRATWNGVSRDILLTWKNYPYLSVETEVAPETVAVGEPVDVTIRLKGDGWALQPDPIDVVLVIDRSGSMSGTDVSPTRMAAAKAAANDFVDQMSLTTRDRVALVSFAFDATLDQGLTDNPSLIKGAINTLSPDGATNMRLAYYTAIKYLKENGRPDAVKAVILMGDGDWNYHGSPLAKGIGYADNNRYLTSDWYSNPYWAPLSAYRWSGSSYSFVHERYEWYHGLPEPNGDANVRRELDEGKWRDTSQNVWVYNYKPNSWTCDNGQLTNQNMAVYAMSGDEINKVKIYSIGFASALNSNVEEDLGVLSEATGGKYVWAGNEAELRKVYTDIAGELKTEAGVDTQMDVSFKNVEVNEAPVSGADVFDYVYAAGTSTTISSWVDNETGHYDIVPFTTIDQTADWSDDNNLHFDIGTVHLNQVWETTFRLNVTKPGNINIFGPDSTISFNGGEDTLKLPDTFITAIEGLTNRGMMSRVISVELAEPVLPAGQDAFSDAVPLTWKITYDGTCDIDEALAYSDDGGLSWRVFLTKTIPNGEMGDNTCKEDSTWLNARDLLPGDYLIRVVTSALDTPEAMDMTNAPIRIGNASGAFIRIG